MDEYILIKDHSRQEGYTDIQKFLFSCGCKWQLSVDKQQIFDFDDKQRVFIVSLKSGSMTHKKTRKKMDEVAKDFNKPVIGTYSYRDEQKEIAYVIHTYDNSLVVDDNTEIYLPYERWKKLRDVLDYMKQAQKADKFRKITNMDIDLVKETVMSQKYYWCERTILNLLYYKYKDEAQRMVAQ